MNAVINFSHLEEEFNFFPCNCISGFYFFWNTRLAAQAVEKDEIEALVQAELALQKQTGTRGFR